MNRRLNSLRKSFFSVLLIAASYLSASLTTGCAVQTDSAGEGAPIAVRVQDVTVRVKDANGSIKSARTWSTDAMRSRNEQLLSTLFRDAPTQPERIFDDESTSLRLSGGESLFLTREGHTLRAATDGADVRMHVELTPIEAAGPEMMLITTPDTSFAIEVEAADRTTAREVLASVALSFFAYVVLGPDALPQGLAGGGPI